MFLPTALTPQAQLSLLSHYLSVEFRYYPAPNPLQKLPGSVLENRATSVVGKPHRPLMPHVLKINSWTSRGFQGKGGPNPLMSHLWRQPRNKSKNTLTENPYPHIRHQIMGIHHSFCAT
jgi:hypothetical protein